MWITKLPALFLIYKTIVIDPDIPWESNNSPFNPAKLCYCQLPSRREFYVNVYKEITSVAYSTLMSLN